jgi:hypothetical protein
VALTRPSAELARKPPTGSLLSPRILLSLLAQIALQAIAQAALYTALRRQPWSAALTTHIHTLSATLDLRIRARTSSRVIVLLWG